MERGSLQPLSHSEVCSESVMTSSHPGTVHWDHKLDPKWNRRLWGMMSCHVRSHNAALITLQLVGYLNLLFAMLAT